MPDHNKKLHIIIIRTLSKTDRMLSVLNSNNAEILERTYRIDDKSTWLNPTIPSSFSCSLLYPIINPIRNIIIKYPILRNIFA